MEPDISPGPFLPFGQLEAREYGGIRLFDPAAKPDGLPFLYSRFSVAPGRTSRRDQHEVQEVWVILSGVGKLTVDDGEFDVKFGDVIHFASMRVHQVLNQGSEDMNVFSFWWPHG